MSPCPRPRRNSLVEDVSAAGSWSRVPWRGGNRARNALHCCPASGIPQVPRATGRSGMMILARRTGWIAGAAVGLTCALSTALWAGGSGFGDDDHDDEN